MGGICISVEGNIVSVLRRNRRWSKGEGCSEKICLKKEESKSQDATRNSVGTTFVLPEGKTLNKGIIMRGRRTHVKTWKHENQVGKRASMLQRGNLN